MTKENIKRRRSRFQKTYMRYAKYIKSDLKLLKEKILEMELWTVTGESSKSFPFPPWPFMTFAVTQILENITARIIFWHSNVIAPTRMCVLLLPCSFGSLTCLTDWKRVTFMGLLLLFSASNPMLSYWPESQQLLGHTINVSIIECLTKKVRALKILWLVIMPPSNTTTITTPHLTLSPSAASRFLSSRKRCDMETSLRGKVFPPRLGQCPRLHRSF